MRRLVLLVAALALVAGCTSHGGTPAQRRPAPALAGPLLDGGSYDLADHRGEVVVINFWASWCAPCRAEATDLEETYQATRAQGVSFVGINTSDPDTDKAKAFVDGRATYPSVVDTAGRLAMAFAAFGATTLPATVLVDRQGRVAQVIREPVRRAGFEPLVTQLAGEPRP